MPLSIGSSKNLLVVIVRESRTVNISLEGCKDYDHLKAVHIPQSKLGYPQQVNVEIKRAEKLPAFRSCGQEFTQLLIRQIKGIILM